MLIIGAGFGGIGLAQRLRQAGVRDVVVLERGDDVGGVWRDNRYPGAACDVPSRLYSFSFAPWARWSRRFATQPEILAYLHDCVARFGLRHLIHTGVEVTDARFDASSGAWLVTDAAGRSWHARVLVSAVGQLGRPRQPDIAGLEAFDGPVVHTAQWPEGLDLTDQRVAVIGTGASAVQVIPALARTVRHLTVFQRSAPWVLPKPDRALPRWERWLMARVPLLQRLDRLRTWLVYEARGAPLLALPGLLQLYTWRVRWQLWRQVPDPVLRRQLTPTDALGCKRVLIANDYYAAFSQMQVALTTTPIQQIGPHAVTTTDGAQHGVDAIVLATGFEAHDFLAPILITGPDGRTLQEAWADGARAYLGITVPGFPNLFLLYGPNTNLGHNSIVYMLESQFRYVLGCLDLLRSQGAAWMDVRPEVAEAFDVTTQAALRASVWASGCRSWYVDARGRHTTNWPGFTFTYRYRTRAPDPADFVLGGSEPKAAARLAADSQ